MVFGTASPHRTPMFVAALKQPSVSIHVFIWNHAALLDRVTGFIVDHSFACVIIHSQTRVAPMLWFNHVLSLPRNLTA